VLCVAPGGRAASRQSFLPDQPCTDCFEWIVDWISQSDGVLLARVTAVEPEFYLTRTLGDWAFVAVGSRFGLPEHDGECVLRLDNRRALKGTAPGPVSLRYKAPSVESTYQWSDVSHSPRRIVESHDYIFFLQGPSPNVRLWRFIDVTAEPTLLPEVLANFPSSDVGGPRRRTMRSSRPARLTLRVQSTRRTSKLSAKRER